MDYNTDRERLLLPEFGRNIQNMVNYALTIEDREKRQRCAETIIRLMAMVGRKEKNETIAPQVLWDQLARMSHYRLDIDYPYEITPEADVMAKPKPIPYPNHNIRAHHYGHLLEELIRTVSAMPEGEERETILGLAAGQMKKDLFYWNPDALSKEKIVGDLEWLSSDRLSLNQTQAYDAYQTEVNDTPEGTGKKRRGRPRKNK